MKIKRAHWRHFFGGVALCLLLVQFFSGLILTMFYLPHLNEAYASLQRIYNELAAVAWIRDSHRWVALFLCVTIVVHFIRSFLRKDYLNSRKSKTFWLTGVLLFLPLLGFLLTGFELPWEWRGYWFMEMTANYTGQLPWIGPALKAFLIDAFTLNRAMVAHVVILPVITLVLMEIHSILRMHKRKGGLSRYIVEHGLFTIPFLLVIGVLAYALAMPTQDPHIIPLPLDGRYIPSSEWFILFFYLPFLHAKGFMVPFLSLYIPVCIFLTLAIFPYLLKRKKLGGKSGEEMNHDGKSSKHNKITLFIRRTPGLKTLAKSAAFLSVFMVSMTLFGSLYAGTSLSPTMGCNSCHNLASGMRMGRPPVTFKNRGKNPVLENNHWMLEHWFYPTVVW